MSIPYLLTDKQQKLEQKMKELQDIKDKVNFYDVAYVRFDVPEIKVKPPKITERPPRFGNIDDWMKAQNATVSEQFHNALNSFGKTVMDAAKNSILGERKFRLMNQRDMEKLNEDYHTEKYLRHQQIHETLDLLALFEKPDTAKLVLEVAVALMGGRYVSIPCAGGGSVSSETAGTVARKTRRTRTSDSVVGFMQQRPSKLLDICRQREKDMADNLLFIEHSYLVEKGVSAFFIICIRASCSFYKSFSSLFSQKTINIADCRSVLAMACEYFYIFVVRI